MTTRIESKNILLKEFNDNFDNTIPISYTNQDSFKLTTGVDTEKPFDSAWVRLKIQNNDSDQVSYGSPNNRKFGRFGLISYQVFIPQNTGTFDGDTICEEINNIFEGNRFGIIYCEEGSWSEVENIENDFYQFNGTIRFNFDQVK